MAVVLHARSTVKKVNEITALLFAMARASRQIVKLGVQQIEGIIRPHGLTPAKARDIHGLSRIILEKHGGKVPDPITFLDALPAEGHKTASVVMAEAFSVPAFPADTHIHPSPGAGR